MVGALDAICSDTTFVGTYDIYEADKLKDYLFEKVLPFDSNRKKIAKSDRELLWKIKSKKELTEISDMLFPS